MACSGGRNVLRGLGQVLPLGFSPQAPLGHSCPEQEHLVLPLQTLPASPAAQVQRRGLGPTLASAAILQGGSSQCEACWAPAGGCQLAVCPKLFHLCCFLQPLPLELCSGPRGQASATPS